MRSDGRAPRGPRGALGAAAEDAAAEHLLRQGWSVLARNVRVGADELDIIALEPLSPPTLVVVEVRSRSGPRFGSAIESIDGHKVQRLYRAVSRLRRGGHPALGLDVPPCREWRVDLLTLRRRGRDAWRIERHVRGLRPP
jgi:putative endonuclease